MYLPEYFVAGIRKKEKKKKTLTAVSFVIKRKKKELCPEPFPDLPLTAIKEIQQKLEGVWSSVLVPPQQLPQSQGKTGCAGCPPAWSLGEGVRMGR